MFSTILTGNKFDSPLTTMSEISVSAVPFADQIWDMLKIPLGIILGTFIIVFIVSLARLLLKFSSQSDSPFYRDTGFYAKLRSSFFHLSGGRKKDQSYEDLRKKPGAMTPYDVGEPSPGYRNRDGTFEP